MVKKSINALRVIGEAASEVGVEPHVLRFWETKFRQIKTIRRNRRRYYDSDTMQILRSICWLLKNERYTIEGAQKLLGRIGAKGVLSLYFEHTQSTTPAALGSAIQSINSRTSTNYLREHVASTIREHRPSDDKEQINAIRKTISLALTSNNDMWQRVDNFLVQPSQT